MAKKLEGSCRCGAVAFRVMSHTPYPYQLCYCSICRKTAGGGGYAINLAADARTLKIDDPDNVIQIFRADIRQDDGSCERSTAERNFCTRCGTALWLFSPEWPDLVHPFASAIDSELPAPPSSVHMMLRYRPSWVQADIGEGDAVFDLYPDQSIEDWHRNRGLWIA